MIKIDIDKNIIIFNGHSLPDICAAVSSVMYTTMNAILKYDETSVEYKDENDIVTIKIIKHDKIVDLLIINMIDMLNDIHSDYGDNYVQIKGCYS